MGDQYLGKIAGWILMVKGIGQEYADNNRDGVCDMVYNIEYDGNDHLPLKDKGDVPRMIPTESR